MKKILITKNLLPVIIISIVFINQNSIARANCAGFTIAHSICMASKSSDDPAASTLCTIEAGAQCDQIDRRQKVTPPPPTRVVTSQPDFADPQSNNFNPIIPSSPDDDQTTSPVNPTTIQNLVDPADTYTPGQPAPQVRNYTPVKPAAPVATCQHDGSYFFPGQKRYECSDPRERGVCETDAGYGIPYVCDAIGNWNPGNDGLAECSSACALDTILDYTQNTCVYSQKRDDEQGDVCYAGTGGYGFNPAEGCNYSYGPVECPVLPDDIEQSSSQVPAKPDTEQLSSPENNCSGEISSICGGEGNHTLTTSWSITPIQGEGTCNVFIRDGFGDHTISNDCRGSWSGIEIPGGGGNVLGGTNYELYVSNGTDSCLNVLASNVQLSCEPASDEKNNETWSIANPINWIEDWF